MSGLGLDRLQCHAGFAKLRETCVSELVAGRLFQLGTSSRPRQGLVEPRRTQRLASPRAFQHHERRVARRVWAFQLEILSDPGGELRRDWDHPLAASLALGNEHPAFTDSQILQTQTEDLASSQPAQQHRVDHRPVAPRPQCCPQCGDRCRRQHTRQRPRGPHHRHAASTMPFPRSTSSQPARHRTRHDAGIATMPASPRITR